MKSLANRIIFYFLYRCLKFTYFDLAADFWLGCLEFILRFERLLRKSSHGNYIACIGMHRHGCSLEIPHYQTAKPLQVNVSR